MSFYALARKPVVADVPRQVSLHQLPGSNMLSCYVIIKFMYILINRVTYICIDYEKKIRIIYIIFILCVHIWTTRLH